MDHVTNPKNVCVAQQHAVSDAIFVALSNATFVLKRKLPAMSLQFLCDSSAMIATNSQNRPQVSSSYIKF